MVEVNIDCSQEKLPLIVDDGRWLMVDDGRWLIVDDGRWLIG